MTHAVGLTATHRSSFGKVSHIPQQHELRCAVFRGANGIQILLIELRIHGGFLIAGQGRRYSTS